MLLRQTQTGFHSLQEKLYRTGQCLVIVGGLEKREKLRLVNERFGLDVEWHAIDRDSAPAMDSIIRRIRSGRIAGVVLLLGLMSHKVSSQIRAACQACNVPLANGDRAGTASLELAFTELERKLA